MIIATTDPAVNPCLAGYCTGAERSSYAFGTNFNDTEFTQ
jgi:hypothetical protein